MATLGTEDALSVPMEVAKPGEAAEEDLTPVTVDDSVDAPEEANAAPEVDAIEVIAEAVAELPMSDLPASEPIDASGESLAEAAAEETTMAAASMDEAEETMQPSSASSDDPRQFPVQTVAAGDALMYDCLAPSEDGEFSLDVVYRSASVRYRYPKILHPDGRVTELAVAASDMLRAVFVLDAEGNEQDAHFFETAPSEM